MILIVRVENHELLTESGPRNVNDRWFMFWKLLLQIYYQQAAVEGNKKKPGLMPALVKKPGQGTLGTKRNLKRLADFLKMIFQVVFCGFFWNVYLSLISGKLNTHDQGKVYGSSDKEEDKSHRRKDFFFFKDFFASRKCKVIGRTISMRLHWCLFLSLFWTSGPRKDLHHLKLKVGESTPQQRDLEQVHLSDPQLPHWLKRGSDRKVTEIQTTCKIFQCTKVNYFL